MNNKMLITSFLALVLLLSCNFSEEETKHNSQNQIRQEAGFLVDNDSLLATDTIPDGIKKLLAAYPNFLKSATSNSIIWNDGTVMVYDDGIENKDFATLLDAPDLEDQMAMPYPKGSSYEIPQKYFDPGRIRYEPFFFKMYGNSKQEVQANLATVVWLPSSLNVKLQVTKINGVNEKLQAVSNELDSMPLLRKYLENPGGTFNWRTIEGTNRMSTHAFATSVDINVSFSNYWKWVTSDIDADLEYKNRIPMEIVEVFEKHGFIWGGKWYHYDTMHFEYRPELLLD